MSTYLSAPGFNTNIFLNQFAEWNVASRRGAKSFARRTHAAGPQAGPTIITPLAGPGGQ